MRSVRLEAHALDDMRHWVQHEPKLLRRILEPIADIQRSPFAGIGKPEPLKHEYKGFWSRRINDEHRLIYCVKDDEVIIASCRYHYR